MLKNKFVYGLRDVYFNELYKIFQKDKDVIFISADNGAPSLDKFVQNFPDRFFNVGIAEQQMIGMAAGMALEGKKVYTYAIAPFITSRCYEQIKIDICAANLPITMIGVGTGYAYDTMGPTHHSTEDLSIMRTLPNMNIYTPTDSQIAKFLVNIIHRSKTPQYIRFDRTNIPEIYKSKPLTLKDGYAIWGNDCELIIISTGIMTSNSLIVQSNLAKHNLKSQVIDIIRSKPLSPKILEKLKYAKKIITIEETLLMGGLGSIILEFLSDNNLNIPVKRFGQKDKFVFDNGGRQEIWNKYKLSSEHITKEIINNEK